MWGASWWGRMRKKRRGVDCPWAGGAAFGFEFLGRRSFAVSKGRRFGSVFGNRTALPHVYLLVNSSKLGVRLEYVKEQEPVKLGEEHGVTNFL